MKDVIFTIQEIWMATRPNIQKSKKVYSRKNKHKDGYKRIYDRVG